MPKKLSFQPLHTPLRENDPDIWPTRMRKEDWDSAFAWRTMHDAGAHITFGSDSPVALPDPIISVAGAVNRRPWRP